MSWRIATCDRCGQSNPAQIFIKDEIWYTIAKRKDILCFDCIQQLLGRKITVDDLRPGYGTDEILLGVRIATEEFVK